MWTRQTTADGIPRDAIRETWSNSDGLSFDVDVRIGKPLDVLKLKGADLQEVKAYAEFLSKSAARLFGPSAGRRRLEECPCCANPSVTSKEALTVYGATYVQCAACGHVYVLDQPGPDELDKLFTESE